MPSVTWVCGSCRDTRAAHLYAFPGCDVTWHDGWDRHQEEGRGPWLTGSRADLRVWVERHEHEHADK
ncbi:MAG: hypothetical protein M3467_03275 [Actinomycetota bacterium]|nr:hypothetical protein [Actinomycetota bacterium]